MNASACVETGNVTSLNFAFSTLVRKDRNIRDETCFVLQPADVYLIDEPSAYLDSEQRLVAAKVIKRLV